MNTGVHYLGTICFRLLLPDLMTCNKDLSNRPIYMYAVLNTYTLDMILQLIYMLIVMNPTRIASGNWKSKKCYGL